MTTSRKQDALVTDKLTVLSPACVSIGDKVSGSQNWEAGGTASAWPGPSQDVIGLVRWHAFQSSVGEEDNIYGRLF